MKRYEALVSDLTKFEPLDDYRREYVVEYINCPSSDDCKYDGVHDECCSKCKIKWLLEEWE